MASRKDVAELAGVSPASVSYYINQNGYVSKEAGEKIQFAVDKLNYTPNAIARSLRIKDSKQFVFFCNDIRNPFYSQLVHRATKVATEKDYTVLFSPVVDNEEHIKKMVSFQVSGVFASNNHMNVNQINNIAKRDIPVVLLRDIDWPDLDESVSQIKVLFASIMEEIVEHLKEEGAKNICYIASCSSLNIGKIDSKTTAFIKASKDIKHSVLHNISATADGYNSFLEAFKEDPSIDSVVCTNDGVALGVLKAAEKLNLSVPEDIKIIGFDNSSISQYSNPPITSVDINSDEIGKIAVDMLLSKTKKETVEDVIIKPKLIIRRSSKKIKHFYMEITK
ncbi:MAG: LacI family DNA-binding transcriptional regulator [Spirochaetaceae bacterium]|nr:LacI family DNA-binding transcriptional regulator [Spirochaetaceae bacterium]